MPQVPEKCIKNWNYIDLSGLSHVVNYCGSPFRRPFDIPSGGCIPPELKGFIKALTNSGIVTVDRISDCQESIIRYIFSN